MLILKSLRHLTILKPSIQKNIWTGHSGKLSEKTSIHYQKLKLITKENRLLKNHSFHHNLLPWTLNLNKLSFWDIGESEDLLSNWDFCCLMLVYLSKIKSILAENNGLKTINKTSAFHSLTFHIWLTDNSNLLNHQPFKNILSIDLTIKNCLERTFKTQSELSPFWVFLMMFGAKSPKTSGKKMNKLLNKLLKKLHQNSTILPNSLEKEILSLNIWQLLTSLLLKDLTILNSCSQNNSKLGNSWEESVKTSTTYHQLKPIMPEKTPLKLHSCHHLLSLTQQHEFYSLKIWVINI